MKRMLILLSLFTVILFTITGCFPYVYYNQSEVLINGADIDGTLKIAQAELEEGGFDSILTVWAIRDQEISESQADEISRLYFLYIEKVGGIKDRTIAEFDIWHFAWAVSNFYRNNNADIKIKLENAYKDAVKRPGQLKIFKDIAKEHISGIKIYMGDIHDLGRSYAYSHIIVPGNKKYIQSLKEYYDKKQKKLDKKTKK